MSDNRSSSLLVITTAPPSTLGLTLAGLGFVYLRLRSLYVYVGEGNGAHPFPKPMPALPNVDITYRDRLAKRWALGCVNSPPGPEGIRRRDSRNLGPTC